MSRKNSNDTIGNRNRDLPASSAVPQPTALRRTQFRESTCALCCGQSDNETGFILVFQISPFIILPPVSQNNISFVYDRRCVTLQLAEFLKTRQTTHGKHVEARSSLNHFCCGKAMSVAYSECLVVALDNQYAKAHATYFHPWPVSLYNIFSPYVKNGRIFGEKKVTEHKMCVLIFSKIFV
jgi:hypothetical protein